MLRTMWFAFACVAILCTTAAIRIAMMPLPPAIASNAAPMDTDIASGPNTAAKSDRLYIPGKVQPMETDPVTSLVTTIPVKVTPHPSEAADTATDEPHHRMTDAATKTTKHRHWQDANAKLVDDPPPRRRAKAKPQAATASNDRTTTTSDQGKTTSHTFQCRRDGFGSLLRSLDLSPNCSS